jgi:hypothetical protein
MSYTHFQRALITHVLLTYAGDVFFDTQPPPTPLPPGHGMQYPSSSHAPY